jgi:cell division septation protein DedD
VGNKFFFIVLILITVCYAFSCSNDENAPPPDASQAPAVDEPVQHSKDRVEPPKDPEIANVVTEPVETETIVEDEKPEIVPSEDFIVQVGAYQRIDYANEIAEKLTALNLDIQIIKKGTFHKVRIVEIETKEQAALLVDMVKKEFKLNPLLIRAQKK